MFLVLVVSVILFRYWFLEETTLNLTLWLSKVKAEKIQFLYVRDVGVQLWRQFLPFPGEWCSVIVCVHVSELMYLFLVTEEVSALYFDSMLKPTEVKFNLKTFFLQQNDVFAVYQNCMIGM